MRSISNHADNKKALKDINFGILLKFLVSIFPVLKLTS